MFLFVLTRWLLLRYCSCPCFFVQVIVFGTIMGADGVGRIAEVKGNSFKHKVGDRVVVMPSVGWTKDPRGPEEDYYILGGGPAPGKDSIFLFITGGKHRPAASKRKNRMGGNRCSIEKQP